MPHTKSPYSRTHRGCFPVALSRHASYSGDAPAIAQALPGIKSRGIGVASVLVQPQNVHTLCRLTNVKPTPQTLYRGTRIAYLFPIDASDPFNESALRGDQTKTLHICQS